MDALRNAAQAVRYKAEEATDQVASYTREEPIKALLIAAAVGAGLMSLLGLNSQQQAGVLNQLIQSIGPAAMSGVAGGVLGRLLGGSGNTGGTAPMVTPAQASQFSPTDVSAISAHVEQQDPSVIDRIGAFYAQHPTLVRTMGAVALSAVMGHLSANR